MRCVPRKSVFAPFLLSIPQPTTKKRVHLTTFIFKGCSWMRMFMIRSVHCMLLLCVHTRQLLRVFCVLLLYTHAHAP